MKWRSNYLAFISLDLRAMDIPTTHPEIGKNFVPPLSCEYIGSGLSCISEDFGSVSYFLPFVSWQSLKIYKCRGYKLKDTLTGHLH